jgi:hypothetical protein
VSYLLSAQAYALEAILGADADHKCVSYANVVFVIAINMNRAVNCLTNDLHLFAKSFCAPTVKLCITYIAFSHEEVQLIAVMGEDVLT